MYDSTRNFTISGHCARRAAQRGYRATDLDILERIATLAPDGLFVRRRDAEREIKGLESRLRRLRGSRSTQASVEKAELVRRIDRLMRLQGTFLPVSEGGALKTVYRSSPRRTKRVLRDHRQR